jgi:lysophospholipase L1-like esterase
MAHPTWRGRVAASVRAWHGAGRLGGTPRRREMASILALLLVASVVSAAGLSGGSSGKGGSGGDGGPSTTGSPADTGLVSASANPTVEPTLTPDPALLALQYSVPMAPDPTPEPTPSPVPTAVPKKSTLPAPKPATAPAPIYSFVALGDSLTAWPANPWPSRLDSIDPQLRLIHNAGVPGNLTWQMKGRLSADVLAYKPNALFVMGGTNDLAAGVGQATIIANLRAIATTAQSHGIHVFLLTIPPDSYPAMVSRVNALNGAIVALGTSLGVRVTNIYRPLASSAGTYVARYTSDGLHLSSLGAQVVANTIYARIKPVGY